MSCEARGQICAGGAARGRPAEGGAHHGQGGDEKDGRGENLQREQQEESGRQEGGARGVGSDHRELPAAAEGGGSGAAAEGGHRAHPDRRRQGGPAARAGAERPLQRPEAAEGAAEPAAARHHRVHRLHYQSTWKRSLVAREPQRSISRRSAHGSHAQLASLAGRAAE